MKRIIAGLVTALTLAACGTSTPFIIPEQSPANRPVREFDRRTAGYLPVLGDSLRLPRGNPVFYEDDGRRINVEGQASGLPDNVSRLYVMLFTDYAGDFFVQREFDRQLKNYLQNMGYDPDAGLADSQAVIGGSILEFAATDSRRVTNIEGLIYTLKIEYEITLKANGFRYPVRFIEERLIIADTNAYTTNEVIPMMADTAAQHASEAIRYGHQLSSGWTNGNIPVLGN